MKNKFLILIIILIRISADLTAQVEFPILDAKWCYNAYGDFGQNLGNYCFTPDSLFDIGGHIYSRISYKKDPNNKYEEILYREEDLKFYVIPQDSINEILIYDFNLVEGDTFWTNWGWGLNDSIGLVVQNVDSITTLDGEQRKRITLENGEYYGQWIEGVGSLDWVFVFPTYLSSLSGGFSFICHSKGEELIYPDWADAEACDFITKIHNNEKEVFCEIYPNPSSGDINIKLKNLEVEYIQIIDLTGKVILENKIDLNQNLIEFTDSFNSGIYFMKFFNEHKVIKIKKILCP